MLFVQQPCDKTASYRLFKLHQKRGIAIATSSEAHKEHPYMKVVEKAIGGIDSASRETFRKFFLALPTLLHVAFSPEHMSRGFADTGLVPFDPVKILRHWPLFSKLTTLAVNGLIDACNELTNWVITSSRGYITYSATSCPRTVASRRRRSTSSIACTTCSMDAGARCGSTRPPQRHDGQRTLRCNGSERLSGCRTQAAAAVGDAVLAVVVGVVMAAAVVMRQDGAVAGGEEEDEVGVQVEEVEPQDWPPMIVIPAAVMTSLNKNGE